MTRTEVRAVDAPRASTSGRIRLLVAVGIVSLAGAAVSIWVVAPSRLGPASGARTVRVFDGTAYLLVDPQALTRGEVAVAVRRDTPVTAGRIARAVTAGDLARVRDAWVLKAGRADWTVTDRFDRYDGEVISRVERTYSVDRTSMMVTGHRGLAVDWPRGARERDYPGWVGDTAGTTVFRFTGTGSRPVDRYVASSPVPSTTLRTLLYESTTEPATITDRPALAGLPRSLPVATVSALAAAVLPADARRQVDQALGSLTGPVAVDYTYEATMRFAVEPTSGVVVDADRREVRRMRVHLPDGTTTPPLTVSDVALRMECTRYECAGTDAWDAIDRGRLWGRTVPAVLLGLGAGCLIVAGWFIVRAGHVAPWRRRRLLPRP
jgi:Porin PorA